MVAAYRTLALALVAFAVHGGAIRAGTTGELTGDLQADEHRIAVITIDTKDSTSARLWEYDDKALHAIEAGGKLYVTGKPGTYKLTCKLVSSSGGGKADVKVITGELVIRPAKEGK